ncbi:DNA/RNA polymerase [Dentipellis sp. KUC8613]|nr:DNA/RNA polymerase [Dentipellis sp. KUC8613]
MHDFLRTPAPYTLLPTPLPNDCTSAENELFFMDSPTQDLLSVVDACLHNLYDVRRAKQIFDDLRARKPGDPKFDTRLYNSMLRAYMDMADVLEPSRRAIWMDDAWILFQVIESGEEQVQPNAGTYALGLLMWSKFSREGSPQYIADSADLTSHTPTTLLRNIIDRQIPITAVISDRAFTNSKDVEQVIQLLSKAAVELDLPSVLQELGQAEALGALDTLQTPELPEVVPVHPISEPGNVENEVPFKIENLRRHLAQFTLARRVLPEDAAARQKLLEESVYDDAVERLRVQAEKLDELGLNNSELKQTDLQHWMWDWHTKLTARLKKDILQLVKQEELSPPKASVYRLGPFLSLLKPEKLSLLTILELMRLHGSGGVSEGMKTARGLLAVGKAVELEYKALVCRKNKISVPMTSARGPGQGSYFSRFSYNDLHARRLTAFKYMEDAEEWTSDWTQNTKVKVGSFLVDRLIDCATVTRTAVSKVTGEEVSEEHPAFFHSYEYMRGHKLGVIKLNPIIAQRMAKDGLRETLHPRHMPMLTKPKPWVSHDNGGYMYNKAPVMRFKESKEQLAYIKQACEEGNIELVLAGLDVLGATPWRINRRIFDVVLEVWNSGERMGKLPPAVYDIPEPPRSEDADTDPQARSVYLQRHRAWLQERANNHSDRCSVNYKIEIARAFIDDTIYFPHNLDFRGRAYPIPPHLNHIGDDLSRGLLLFADKKPLGVRGLRWLKIHLANLYGYDKATFDERVAFVEQRLDDIFDSAENPLTGRRWWGKADDPWQCLATCMELKAALESPDPLAYECALPVHQDGTCNGLQHYAALGGDAQGAKQVNLDVAERPSDVYTYVANMVEDAINKDIGKDKYAALLAGKISRKVVKQTVMTTVYGVTFIGAREQIHKQLRDRGDISEEEQYIASIYLAKKVLQCIGDLFKGAQAIQDYLTSCARLIAKSVPGTRLTEAMKVERKKSGKTASRLRKEQMTSVVWTTPLGLPIVQPYRKVKRRQIETGLQSVYISDPNVQSEVNTQKQASAFPPNFIHSLDATHMLLTALECQTQGLTFASVHDSYWTHPCDIDQMSEIIRNTFISLHSSDVLGRLDAEFRERYANYKVPVVSLRTESLMRSLGLTENDTLVTTSEEEAAALESADVSSVLVEGEAAPAAENGVVTISREQVKAELNKKKRGTARRTKAAAAAAEAEDGAGAEGDVPAKFQTKFVNLTDMLPRLPKKGEFDVSKIRQSLYFFS